MFTLHGSSAQESGGTPEGVPPLAEEVWGFGSATAPTPSGQACEADPDDRHARGLGNE